MLGRFLQVCKSRQNAVGCILSQIAKFMGPTWDPPGSYRPRWAPCWPHEPCYLRCFTRQCEQSVEWPPMVIAGNIETNEIWYIKNVAGKSAILLYVACWLTALDNLTDLVYCVTTSLWGSSFILVSISLGTHMSTTRMPSQPTHVYIYHVITAVLACYCHVLEKTSHNLSLW